ncbi:hypothetical protein [Limisalsivibrio acetivorans]|uniref:hypothetical protein n=1 Tax=Limisalsivibrio acetivorans TaxID=1304888 RepID=UPI0003B50035|nr:hypothetical protein [Limisalsivibrio acetivorans]
MTAGYYIRLVFLLCVLYILSGSILSFMSPLDFFLIAFLAIVGRVDEENFLYHGIIFGIFYDFRLGWVFGPSVILFILYGFLRQHAHIVLDMDKALSRFIFRAGIAVFHIIVIMLLTGHLTATFFEVFIYRSLVNVAAVGVVVIAPEVSSAFKTLK